jgi:hypothetical protein
MAPCFDAHCRCWRPSPGSRVTKRMMHTRPQKKNRQGISQYPSCGQSPDCLRRVPSALRVCVSTPLMNLVCKTSFTTELTKPRISLNFVPVLRTVYYTDEVNFQTICIHMWCVVDDLNSQNVVPGSISRSCGHKSRVLRVDVRGYRIWYRYRYSSASNEKLPGMSRTKGASEHWSSIYPLFPPQQKGSARSTPIFTPYLTNISHNRWDCLEYMRVR